MIELQKTFSALLFSALLLCPSPYSQTAHAGLKDRRSQEQRLSNLSPGFYDHSRGSPLIDLIDHTQSTLEIEIYEMNSPRVIQSIRKALTRGVKVRIVKEPNPVGATCHVFEPINNSLNSACDDQKQLVVDVTNAGGQYVPFVKPSLCGDGKKNCLEHGKLVISDAKRAMLSTGNFNSSSLCELEYAPVKCNREYSYLSTDSDVVSSFRAIFEKDLEGEKYNVNDVIIPSAQSKITVSPNSMEPLLDFIRSAKKQILVENQYLKEPTINKALIEAAQDGVQVQVILASACSFGKPKPNEAKKLTSIFKAFDEAGIELKMFTKKIKIGGRPGYMHAKAMVVDGVKAWVGSVNGSTQAITLNREFGIFFDTPADVSKLARKFKQDFADPGEESWQESLDCKENHR